MSLADCILSTSELPALQDPELYEPVSDKSHGILLFLLELCDEPVNDKSRDILLFLLELHEPASNKSHSSFFQYC